MASENRSWQSKKSLIQCNKYMLWNSIATDVNFAVSYQGAGPHKDKPCIIGAHKYMLISRSPVFFSMLCGDWAEGNQADIRQIDGSQAGGNHVIITDVQPEAFQQVLSYIYTDEVDLKPDTVMFILYASKKYMMSGLTDKCTQYLKSNLDASNACTVLEQSIFFEEAELQERCLKCIKYKTKAALESETSLNIGLNTLSKILSLEMFTVKEVDLFLFCLRWAHKQCAKSNRVPSSKHMREALGDCIYLIKFPNMNMNDYTNIVQPSDMLTRGQNEAIYSFLSHTEYSVPLLKFCMDIELMGVTRFRPGPYEIVVTKTDDIRSQTIGTISVNVTIESSSDIKVRELIIGTWIHTSSYVENYTWVNTTTSLHSISYNYSNVIVGYVQDQLTGETQAWKPEADIIIKAGTNNLIMNFVNDYDKPGIQSSAKAIVNAVSRSEIRLLDEHIELKLTSNQGWIPLLGLKYELVF